MMAESVSSLVGYADSDVSDVPGNEKRGVQPPLSGGVVRLLPKCRPFNSAKVRMVPGPAVLLEALSRPVPNPLGAVRVRHERFPLARKAGHSESQPQQESRGIWQGANVPG